MFKSIITLLTLILAFLVCGCSEKKDSVEKYPGFTKVENLNASEKYFIDLKSLEQKDDILSFVLLEELEGGDYIIRTIVTDCNETYSKESGTQYKKEGTLFKNIPKDDKLHVISNNSEMQTIIHYVSQAAKERRFNVGELSIDNAMKLIFSNYNTDGNYSLWKNIKVPNGLDFNDFFPHGVTGKVKKILFLPFEENKTKKYILVTQTVPTGQDFTAHVCAPLISGFVFKQKGDKWFLEVEDRYVTFAGTYGVPPEANLINLSSNKIGVAFTGGDIHQGNINMYLFIMAQVGEKIKEVFNVTLAESNNGAVPEGEKHNKYYNYDSNYEFISGNNPEFKDIKITIRGTRQDDRGNIISANAVKLYYYSKDKYIEKGAVITSETPNRQNGGQPLTPQANHIFEKGRVSKIMAQSGDNNRIKYIEKGAVITSETPNRQNGGQPLTPQANHIFEKGRVLFKEGKYDEALVTLKESILIDANRAWAHYLLAWSYVKLDRDQEAVDSFNNAIRLNPKYALAYAGLGWTYNKMGKYNESIVACKTAIKIMPNLTDAHYNFAIAYNEIGNKSLAMKEYMTVIMLDSQKGVNLYSKIMAKSGDNNRIDNKLGGPNQGTWTHGENKQRM
jgi:tetratricopeptide (TPR) repeat protein